MISAGNTEDELTIALVDLRRTLKRLHAVPPSKPTAFFWLFPAALCAVAMTTFAALSVVLAPSNSVFLKWIVPNVVLIMPIAVLAFTLGYMREWEKRRNAEQDHAIRGHVLTIQDLIARTERHLDMEDAIARLVAAQEMEGTPDASKLLETTDETPMAEGK